MKLSTFALRASLCAPLLLGLVGCGETKDTTPKVLGSLTVTPSVLPFEGGTVQLDWQSNPAGAFVREHTTSGAEVAIEGSPSGTSESFDLQHALQKFPLHSASVIVRPQWLMPPALALARTSTVLAARSMRSGTLIVAGETEEAQAGNALGGRDVFVYRFAAKGALQSSHQIGGAGNDRLLGLRESSLGTHLLLQTAGAGNSDESNFAHVLIDETGLQAPKLAPCLKDMTSVLDWHILPDQTLLALATTQSNASTALLHIVHCNSQFKLLSFSHKTIEIAGGSGSDSDKVNALLVQGSTPAQALVAITTGSDLGAGSNPYPQPQLVHIDVAAGQWQAKRLASPAGHQWLAGVLQTSKETGAASAVQLVGQTRSSANLSERASELWLMQASLDGGFSGKTPLFDGQVKTPCCTAYKASRGPRPSAWVIGSVGSASTATELTAMQLPDLEPIGTIAVQDQNYAQLTLSAIALDASGDFYVVGTALKSDQTRWLRIEQFSEMGQSRVPLGTTQKPE